MIPLVEWRGDADASIDEGTGGSGDLFRARLDQIINMEHELVRLAEAIDWAWIDGELAARFSDAGRPGTASRLIVGLLLLKHIYGLSDERVTTSASSSTG